MQADSILLIDKPPGWTSAKVVSFVKHKLQLSKVGHAGTLDPFATGLLILLVGKATKRFDEFQKMQKEYIGTLEFGTETDTQDPTGSVIYQYQQHIDITHSKLRSVLKQYTGVIEQMPRTMLRYAIERFSIPKKSFYMKK